jgi:hypothetical protein
MRALLLASAVSLILCQAAFAAQPVTINNAANTDSATVTNHKLDVNATVSASITGFRPTAYGTPITATTGGATGTLPTNGGEVVAFNTGADPAYCQLGASVTSAANYIASGGWFAFAISGDTQLTCNGIGGTTTINVAGGSGLPTGVGGGGGGSSSNASVGATGSTIPASATYAGGLNGGNLVGEAVDGSGNQVVVGPGTAGSPSGGVQSVQGVSGGQAVPESIADGASITLGAKADAAWASGSGSVVAILKKVDADVQAGAGSTAATTPTTAINMGCAATSSEPTAVTTGQMQAVACGLSGKLITLPYANKENTARNAGSSSSTGTTITVLAASGSSGLKEYLVGLQCFRTDTATTALYVTLNDSASTTVPVPPVTTGAAITYMIPLVGTANTALTATLSASISTVYCNGQGYYGA